MEIVESKTRGPGNETRGPTNNTGASKRHITGDRSAQAGAKRSIDPTGGRRPRSEKGALSTDTFSHIHATLCLHDRKCTMREELYLHKGSALAAYVVTGQRPRMSARRRYRNLDRNSKAVCGATRGGVSRKLHARARVRLPLTSYTHIYSKVSAHNEISSNSRKL